MSKKGVFIVFNVRELRQNPNLVKEKLETEWKFLEIMENEE